MFKIVKSLVVLVTIMVLALTNIAVGATTYSFVVDYKTPTATFFSFLANFVNGSSLYGIPTISTNMISTVGVISTQDGQRVLLPLMVSDSRVDYMYSAPGRIIGFGAYKNVNDIGNVYSSLSPQLRTYGIANRSGSGEVRMSAIINGQDSLGATKGISIRDVVSPNSYVYSHGFYPYFVKAFDNGDFFVGGVRFASEQQIAPKGTYDFYGMYMHVDATGDISASAVFFSQMYQYASQGSESFFPLYSDSNYWYLLIKRRGVLKDGKVIPAIVSLWKIDKNTLRIVQARDYTYDNPNSSAAFGLIAASTPSSGGIPLLYTAESINTTDGSVFSHGETYIIKFDPVSLTFDFDHLVSTGTKSGQTIFAQQLGDKVIIGNDLGNDKVQFQTIDTVNNKILWVQVFDSPAMNLNKFYVTQSGILFTAINNKAVAIDINTGDIVATYDLPSKSEYVFLLTVGYDPNVAWYAAVVGSEINVYKLRLTSQVIKTYTIKASAQPNGVIKPSGNVVVNEGDTRNFLIIPNPGYKIKDVLVDGKSVGAVSSYTFSNITSNHTIEAIFEEQPTQTIIILQIGNTSFTVNGNTRYLDSPPVIKNGRTLLPIRAIIEALGGVVSWDATARKVTVVLGKNIIELWIGKNTATVNGITKPIDSTNSKVVPEIINGRTMLPLRFVAENLGADVQWNGTTRTITITYKP